MKRLARRFLIDRRGATAVEYGLIAAVIVITMVASFVEVARTNTDVWNNVSNKVAAAR